MSLYMLIPKIHGHIKAKNYIGAIAINNLTFCGERNNSLAIGTISYATGHPANLQKIIIQKNSDIASSDLFSLFCRGSIVEQIQIFQLKPPYYKHWNIKISLFNASFTDLRENISQTSCHESWSISYQRIEKGYTRTNTDGKTSKISYTGYDLTTATPM